MRPLEKSKNTQLSYLGTFRKNGVIRKDSLDLLINGEKLTWREICRADYSVLPAVLPWLAISRWRMPQFSDVIQRG